MCIIWRETEEYIECAWYGMRRREAVGKEWEEQKDKWTPSGRIIHECAYLIAFTSGAKEGIICFILLLSIIHFSSVQSLRQVWLFTTPWISAHQASLSITSSQSLRTHVHWLGDAIQITYLFQISLYTPRF